MNTIAFITFINVGDIFSTQSHEFFGSQIISTQKRGLLIFFLLNFLLRIKPLISVRPYLNFYNFMFE